MHGRCQVVKLKRSKALQSKLLSLIFDILKNPEKSEVTDNENSD